MDKSMPLLKQIALLGKALGLDQEGLNGLTGTEKKLTADFIRECMGNTAINKVALHHVKQHGSDPVFDTVIDITNGSRNQHKPQQEDENPDITRTREYARTRDMARLQPHMEKLVERGVFTKDDPLVVEVAACAKRKKDFEKSIPPSQNPYSKKRSADGEVRNTFAYLVSALNHPELTKGPKR